METTGVILGNVFGTRPTLRLLRSRSERSLVETGDLDGLFRRYHPYVAAIAFRILGRREEVEDVVQDVFLDAHRGLGKLRESRAVKAWLATVTVRKARRRLKRRRFLGFLGIDQGHDYSDVVDGGATPDQLALLSKVFQFLDGLPVEQRLAWSLRFIHGERLERIGFLCECSLATVKRRISAAREAIAGEFTDE